MLVEQPHLKELFVIFPYPLLIIEFESKFKGGGKLKLLEMYLINVTVSLKILDIQFSKKELRLLLLKILIMMHKKNNDDNYVPGDG